MTPEAQRIAIAQACGWEPCEPKKMPGTKAAWLGITHAFRKNGAYYRGLNSIPNYLNDLNAMHEAELSLDWPQKEKFRSILANKFHTLDDEGWALAHSKAIHATAAQRAEAFLRTLNLWTE